MMRQPTIALARRNRGYAREALAAATLVIAAFTPVIHAADADARDFTVAVADDVRLRVVDAGPRNDLPMLLLIPGWRFTADAWFEQIAAFSKTRRVVSFDPRSQGRSSQAAIGNTPEQRARDLDTLIRQLGLRSVVLVGWSQGVQDVAAYLRQFGTASLAGIVLVDAAIRNGAMGVADRPKATAEELSLLNLYANDPDRHTRGMLEAIIQHPRSAAQVDALYADAMRTPVAIGVAMLVADLYGADRTDALTRIDRPLLVVAAASSGELEQQRAMAAAVPGSRFEIVADAGHAVFIDQPQRFDELVASFLDGL